MQLGAKGRGKRKDNARPGSNRPHNSGLTRSHQGLEQLADVTLGLGDDLSTTLLFVSPKLEDRYRKALLEQAPLRMMGLSACVVITFWACSLVSHYAGSQQGQVISSTLLGLVSVMALVPPCVLQAGVHDMLPSAPIGSQVRSTGWMVPSIIMYTVCGFVGVASLAQQSGASSEAMWIFQLVFEVALIQGGLLPWLVAVPCDVPAALLHAYYQIALYGDWSRAVLGVSSLGINAALSYYREAASRTSWVLSSNCKGWLDFHKIQGEMWEDHSSHV